MWLSSETNKPIFKNCCRFNMTCAFLFLFSLRSHEMIRDLCVKIDDFWPGRKKKIGEEKKILTSRKRNIITRQFVYWWCLYSSQCCYYFRMELWTEYEREKKIRKQNRKKTTPVIWFSVHISHSFYFHHIFQSHAEYLDYLNRIFASIFSLLFSLFLLLLILSVTSIAYVFSIDKRKSTKKRLKCCTIWHRHKQIALFTLLCDTKQISRVFEKSIGLFVPFYDSPLN